MLNFLLRKRKTKGLRHITVEHFYYFHGVQKTELLISRCSIDHKILLFIHMPTIFNYRKDCLFFQTFQSFLSLLCFRSCRTIFLHSVCLLNCVHEYCHPWFDLRLMNVSVKNNDTKLRILSFSTYN